MKKLLTFSALLLLLTVVILTAFNCNSNKKPGVGSTATAVSDTSEFANHRDSVPSPQQWSDSLFVLSHAYPDSVKPVVNPPWQKALNGQPISASNTFAYMDSLKSYVKPNVLPFFTDFKHWTAAKHGWFNEPWVGYIREAIMGAYQGNGNPSGMFKTLNEDEQGYALVLYDSTAAYTVGKIWGQTGQAPNLQNNATQFKEGSVIVKFAFSNVNAKGWAPMEGAQTFSIYDTIATKEDPRPGYQVRKVSFFQMDIIVKDSKTAPKTGWVYSTFVYDKDAPGNFWDKMVPLGAMWGNDPGVNSPINPPYPKLYETVINPKAPPYSTETLGWGGRLSGPNDGAVADTAYEVKSKKLYTNLALSSCMSCHSPAQDTIKSFLLPGPPTNFGPGPLMVYAPGSAEWDRWFRDLYGNVPFDAGQVAMDYDMVMAFKSVPGYELANPTAKNQPLLKQIARLATFRQHRRAKSHFWH